jgi:hypothetical protein
VAEAGHAVAGERRRQCHRERREQRHEPDAAPAQQYDAVGAEREQREPRHRARDLESLRASLRLLGLPDRLQQLERAAQSGGEHQRDA